jgi:23S rRNA (guanosine2251-2'-O)-methyltransferase
MSPKITIVLDNVRSGWNVGSIMRTCDALGADLILVGYTPLPLGKSLAVIKKTAIGAEQSVKWSNYTHFQEVLENYPLANHLAIEISQYSQNLFESQSLVKEMQGDIFLWFGNEIHGLSDQLCHSAKAVLHLPMKGSKESLNVSSTVCAVGYLINFFFEF